MSGLNPGSPKHCGLEVVSGRHMPDDWQGSLVTNDFRAHRVCRFVLSEDGSGYASRQEVEVIKSTHVAFRPIDVKMGPDGAIYIADWYNPIIQHGEVDFRDPRRDHVHGRIWRVTAKGSPPVKRPNLTDASITELLDLLKEPEEWNRQFAKLILKSHDRDEVTALGVWLTSLDKNDVHYEHHRLEALWTYQCVGGSNHQLLLELAKADDHRVRAAAIRVVSDWQEQLDDEAIAVYRAAVRDEHPRVRLEAICALEHVPSREAAEITILALERPLDRFLDFALWRTIRELQTHWLPAVMAGEVVFEGNIDRLTFALNAVDSPEVVAPLLRLILREKFPKIALPVC